MNTLKKLQKQLIPVSLLAAASLSAQAESWVDNISVKAEGILITNVKNASVNKSIQNINLVPVTKNLTIPTSGHIDCARKAHVHQGFLQFNSDQPWLKIKIGDIDPFYKKAQHYQKLFDFTPALKNGPNSKSFNHELVVPLTSVKESINSFDPVKVVQEELQKFIAGGGKAIDFYRNNQSFSREVSISFLGSCGRPGKKLPATWGLNGYLDAWMTTTKISVTVNYQGDPAIYALSPKLANQTLPGNIQVKPKEPPAGPGKFASNYNPLLISDAKITAYDKNYAGQCPKHLSFMVEYHGTGKGMVRYHITDMGKTVYVSPQLVYDSSKGWGKHQFSLQVPFGQPQYNKSIQKNFSLSFEVKEQGESAFKPNQKTGFTPLHWSYQCQPQVATPTVGTVKSPGLKPAARPVRAGSH